MIVASAVLNLDDSPLTMMPQTPDSLQANIDSAEADFVSKGSEKELFKEPTALELEDAMSKISHFFGQEDILDHIADVLPYRRSCDSAGPITGQGGTALPRSPRQEGSIIQAKPIAWDDPPLSSGRGLFREETYDPNDEDYNCEPDSNERPAFQQPRFQKPFLVEMSNKPGDVMVETPRANGADPSVTPSAAVNDFFMQSSTEHSVDCEASSQAAPSADGNSQSFLLKMKLGRLGITPTGNADDTRHMRYLHIHEHARDQFQHFAKELKDQLSVECAEFNPYVRALCAHRQEMTESLFDLSDEVVDSLASRLATERTDGLTTLTVEEQRAPCELYCQGESSCKGDIRFDGELLLPELELKHQHLLSKGAGNASFIPSLRSPTSTASTSAASADSDPDARRPRQERSHPQASLKLRTLQGRKRLELSEEDRLDFLHALVDPSVHSEVRMGGGPLRSCGGDTDSPRTVVV